MKTLFFVAMWLSLISCSTNWNKIFSKSEDTDKRNESLMKDFKVDEDVLEKFKTTDSVKKPAQVKVKKIEKTKKTSKKKNVVKTKKNAIPKPATIVKKSEYPKNYPQSLIELNKKTKSTFETFEPRMNIGEKVFMDINYLGVSTGKIVLTTLPKMSMNNRDVFHFNARLQTSRYYSYLYELDDQIDSYVTTDSFTPLKFSLVQRESGQSVDDLQLFDLDKLKGFKFYKRVTKKKTKKNQGEFFLAKYFQDPLSLIYFIRGLDLENNASYLIPFYNKGNLKTFSIKVLGTEKIDTEIGKRVAYKIRASSNYSGDTLKSGDMTFWFSKDADRIFLKFKAKIKIGSISGDIEKYTK